MRPSDFTLDPELIRLREAYDKPCPAGGPAQPRCIKVGPGPYFVTGIVHVCGKKPVDNASRT